MPLPHPSETHTSHRSPRRHRSSEPAPDRRRTSSGLTRGVAASAVLLSGASLLMLSGMLPTGAGAHPGPGAAESVAVSGSTESVEARARQAVRASRVARENQATTGPSRGAPAPSPDPGHLPAPEFPQAPEPPQAPPAPAEPATLPAATGSLAELAGTHMGFGEPHLDGLRTVVVTSAADSGAGTLRAAASGDEPKHVVFAQGMTIRLSTPVSVGSNTVIDGRGRDVVVTAPGESGLVLDEVSNVTIESLTLRGFGDVARTDSNDPHDAIMIAASSDVWIDHNDLSGAGDKLIAVQGGSRGVTISWNRFHDQEQVMQIGAQAGAAADVAQTVTVHHNYFDATGYRNPVVSYGRAHVFNNYYRDWDQYAVRSQRAAQVFFERNVLAGGGSIKATLTAPSGDGCNDAGTRCDSRPGALSAVENVTISGPQLRYEQGGSVFRPADSYVYTADRPDAALAERISGGAGPLG